jgi:putative methylase
MIVRKKDLEIFLQSVPDFEAPRAELEQYITPATIAADMLYKAYFAGDMTGKRVIDLGCGTGILTIGSALLGAEAHGIDVDCRAIAAAERFCAENEIKAHFACMDVSDVREKFDTVVMNPPFGAQKRHADRKFMEKALDIAKVIYHICLKETGDFVLNFYRSRGADALVINDYRLDIKKRFEFHTKDKKGYETLLIRVVK